MTGPASEFYYDGKAMMAYAPAENLVAVADAPATIDAALKMAYDTAAIYYPFTDLIVADPFAALTDGAIPAFYVGPSGVVGGTKTDMVAWANDDVLLQIWIGADDKLPRRIRAIYRTDPAEPARPTTRALPRGSPWRAPASGTYVMGINYASLSAGSMTIDKHSGTYYLSGNTWFQPSHGANGVFDKVVPAP